MELYRFNNLQLGGTKDNYKLIPLKIVKIFEELAKYYDIPCIFKVKGRITAIILNITLAY